MKPQRQRLPQSSSSSSRSSSWRFLLSVPSMRRFVDHTALYYIRRRILAHPWLNTPAKRQRVLLLVVALVLVILKLLQPRILGDGPTIQGGSLGRRMDNTHKRWLFYWRQWRYQSEFQQETKQRMAACPEQGANRFGVPVLLSTFYAETLLRAQGRRDLQRQVLEQQQQGQQHQGHRHHPSLCPRCVFWPLVGEWYRPMPRDTAGEDEASHNKNQEHHHHHSSTKPFSVLIPYLPNEMDQTLLQLAANRSNSNNNNRNPNQSYYNVAQLVYQLQQSWTHDEDGAQLWGLFMMYEFGGGFLGAPRLLDHPGADALFWQHYHPEPGDPQPESVLVWKLQQGHEQQDAAAPTTTLSLQYAFAMQPKARELQCLWDKLHDALISENGDFDHHDQQDAVLQRISWSNVLKFLQKLEQCHSQNPSDWKKECCSSQLYEILVARRTTESSKDPSESTNNKNDKNGQPTTTVTISEQRLAPAPGKTRKHSQLQQMLQDEECIPGGWWCQRCLRLPWRGSFAQCQSVCRACYVNHMTRALPQTPTVQVTVDIARQPQQQTDNGKNNNKNPIPRIIHQTWFEDLTTRNYPHLQRLQNSWKASGWDYRFYTDDTAREYLQQHYPDRFVQAYDALLPGAFKADLFRLLVLLKDGGIYADIDVQLDATSLDQVLPQHVSFFVPRDVPLDRWPHSNYCLWNGFMGAAPGHPIIAQAVQDLMNRIENRWDYYDVERDVCGNHHGDCEIWKLRSIPVLILTGPCALGISINTALGRSNRLEGFNLGWLRPSSNRTASSDAINNQEVETHQLVPEQDGNGLILLTDRYDMGELRFTDVDRSLLVASTNANLFAAGPILAPNRTSVHYSQSETDVMGSSNTYADDWVTNEQIQVKVFHHDG